MNRSQHVPLALALLLAVVCSVAAPLTAQEAKRGRTGDDGANLHFTLTIDDEGERTSRSRELRALALDGRPIVLLTGWRQPIAVTSFNTAVAEDSTVVPITSYQYQDIGIRARLEGRVVEEGRIRVSGAIEVSSMAPSAEQKSDVAAAVSNAPMSVSPARASDPTPAIATVSHDFDVILRDGVEAMLAEVPTPDGSAMALRLEATIER